MGESEGESEREREKERAQMIGKVRREESESVEFRVKTRRFR